MSDTNLELVSAPNNNDCSLFGCRGYTDKIGVLLAQLGTPAAPTVIALRPYLREFLSDPRVIEVNRFVWWFILNFAVLPFRPRRSAVAYSRIWRKDGSPLLRITEDQTFALRDHLVKCGVNDVQVVFGMRYGSPSLEKALDALMTSGCARILILPMYPQYAAATTASTYDACFKHILARRWVPTLSVVQPYYDDERYLSALASIINEHWREGEGRYQKLVLSYHGIPEKYVEKGDPYCCMCTETTKALLPLLNISQDDVIHTYQSRFGKEPWLVPYTDETIERLAKEGIKHIALACPGFTADCLETLDELGIEGKHQFIEAGGESLTLIPCLNSDPRWIESLSQLIIEELAPWFARDKARFEKRLGEKGCGIGCQCPVNEFKKKA